MAHMIVHINETKIRGKSQKKNTILISCVKIWKVLEITMEDGYQVR